MNEIRKMSLLKRLRDWWNEDEDLGNLGALYDEHGNVLDVSEAYTEEEWEQMRQDREDQARGIENRMISDGTWLGFLKSHGYYK